MIKFSVGHLDGEMFSTEYLENTEPGHNKFYRVTVVKFCGHVQAIINWGRIGYFGESQVLSTTPRSLEQKVSGKINKGYSRTRDPLTMHKFTEHIKTIMGRHLGIKLNENDAPLWIVSHVRSVNLHGFEEGLGQQKMTLFGHEEFGRRGACPQASHQIPAALLLSLTHGSLT